MCFQQSQKLALVYCDQHALFQHRAPTIQEILEPNQKKYTKATAKHSFTNIVSNLWKAVTYKTNVSHHVNLTYKKKNNI